MNSFQLNRAASKFASQRADYYEYFSRVLTSSKGAVKINTIISRDVTRYAGKVRGKLSQIWLDRLEENGANLAEAFQGTIPDEEVTVLRVAQQQQAGAVESALLQMASMARQAIEINKAIKGTLYASFFGLLIAALMVTIFPMYVAQDILTNYGYLPPEYWGSKASRLIKYTEWLKSYWFLILGGIASFTYFISWSFNGWVGALRDWADQKIFIWSVYRDIRCASFMTTMATLTTQRGTTSRTILSSVEMLANSVRTKWLLWRIEQIKDLVEETGGSGSDSFNTSFLSRNVYFFLQDMQEACGMADGFQETSKFINQSLVPELIKKLLFFRYVILFIAVGIMIFVYTQNIAVSREMTSAMRLFQTSR